MANMILPLDCASWAWNYIEKLAERFTNYQFEIELALYLFYSPLYIIPTEFTICYNKNDTFPTIAWFSWYLSVYLHATFQIYIWTF